jgi:hypothetical protein
MNRSRFEWNGVGADTAARADARRGPDTHTPEDDPQEDKKVHIDGRRILKWGAIILGLFGVGYVFRGWADSTNGTANLLEALRGRKPDVDLTGLGGGMWPATGFSRPPTPEELSYWSTYYKRGAEAAGALPPSVLPQLPVVERVEMPPPSRQEQAAERSLLAPARPKTPRYAWGGGYGGYGGFQEDYHAPVGGEEYTIVKEG